MQVRATVWLGALIFTTTLAAVLATSSCNNSKPSVASVLAQALWHETPGQRVKVPNEYSYFPEILAVDGRIRVSVRHDDESARLLHVRCQGSDQDCPVDELAPHRRLLRSQATSEEPERYYQLNGGPLDGCVQLIQSRSEIDVATPAYAKAVWGITTGASRR